MSLFNELKRRNVFRVGLAYLVSAWVIAQVADLVLDSIDAPPWVMQAILLVLGLGFIIALIISWAYELTPEGLKKDSDVPLDVSIANHTAKKLDYITIIAALGVLGLFVYQQVNQPSSSTGSSHETNVSQRSSEMLSENTESPESSESSENPKNNIVISQATITSKEVDSIAVLPFVNMSPDKDQEYFADGISEEILNALVKATGLRVAGRTSSFSFKGKGKTIKEISEVLNVAHVLEGSVRKQGDKVRITAQLIKADDGFHLWSETYDGKLDNIFDLQENISRKVTDELKIILNLNPEERLANKMTEDIEAYDLFLRGRELVAKRLDDNIPQGLALLSQAVERDPSFAQAWAVLAEAEVVSYGYIDVGQSEAHKRASSYAQKAIALNNKLALPYAVLSLIEADNGMMLEAIDDLNQALRLEPNNVLINRWIGGIYSRIGRADLATPFYAQAYRLDPLSSTNAFNLASSSFFNGELEIAEKMFRIAGELRNEVIFESSYIYDFQGKHQLARDHTMKAYEEALGRGLELLSNDEMVVLVNAMFGGTEQEKTAARALNGMWLKNSDDQYYWQLQLLVAIGNNDRAYEILESKPSFFTNFSAEATWYPNAAFKDFRADPRFIKLLQKHNYPPAWQSIGWPKYCQPNPGTDGQFSCQ